METDGSLPRSQASATCHYPKPEQSSPFPTSHFLKIRFNIILPSTSRSSQYIRKQWTTNTGDVLTRQTKKTY